MKFRVKDFSTTMQARMVIFGVQVEYFLLYRGNENQPSTDYSPMYSIFFLSVLRNNEIFRQRYLHNRASCMIIFGMQVDDDVVTLNGEPVFIGLLVFIFLQVSF